MASQWSYKRADVRHGPVTTTELRNLASTGGIAPADPVWKEGLAEWLPAGQLNGLFARPSGPPPIPPASVPPPLPPGVGGSEPPPIPAPQSAGMMASAGEFARSAVVAGRRAYAAAPDLAVGRRSVSKRLILAGVSAVAVLMVICAAIFLWAGGSHRQADKAIAQQLAGNWVGVDDPKERVTFDGDQIIVNGDQMATCKLDDSARTVTFTLGDQSDPRPCSAHLSGDGRLYCKRVDTGKGSILAREYVGGWRTPGQVDHGHRMAGLENLDRPQPTRTRIVTPIDHGVAAVPATPPGSDVHGRSTVNADGSMDGSMTGDGYSARSHLNRDGSGEGDYSAGGRTFHVIRKADGTSTIDSR